MTVRGRRTVDHGTSFLDLAVTGQFESCLFPVAASMLLRQLLVWVSLSEAE